MTEKRFGCPHCGSDDIRVTIVTDARLKKVEGGYEVHYDGPNPEDWAGIPEDAVHLYWCGACGHNMETIDEIQAYDPPDDGDFGDWLMEQSRDRKQSNADDS